MQIKYKSILLAAAFAAAAVAAALCLHRSYTDDVLADVDRYLDRIHKIERGYIENLPVYRDFATPEKESRLRKHLLMDHIAVAEASGIRPVRSAGELEELARRGILVAVPSDTESLHYFYNVRKEYRYLAPAAYRGLQEITERLQENIGRRTTMPPVKIAVSSAIRPLDYQKNLMSKNPNATLVSSHSYGVSFDIFFEDYYVSLPKGDAANGLSRLLTEKLNRKFGFLMGDALRRQFRAVLMETLLQLQDEGRIYAILERRQRCYHVTVIQ